MALKFKAKELHDSILFYCSQSEDGQGDFASLALKGGHLEFRFDTGSGPAVLRSVEPVSADRWHEVKIKRKLREASMTLDAGAPVVGKSAGNTRGLNIRTPFYLGGVNTAVLTFAPGVGVDQGFSGCIIEVNMLRLERI